MNKNLGDSFTRDFDVEITESKPTSEQAKTIISYYNKDQLNAESTADAEAALKRAGITRPFLVDWYNGKIAVNDESVAKQILNELSKKST